LGSAVAALRLRVVDDGAMAPKAKPVPAEQAASKKRQRCCFCCPWFCGPLSLYMCVGWINDYSSIWGRFEPFQYECEHPARPVNDSGVQVLVAGFAKTGTRSMSRVLYQLGLEHSYHSEEFNAFVWARHADKFWLDHYGGRWSQMPSVARYVAEQLDTVVLQNTSSEKLAEIVSKCKVDAIALDGIEMLFFPMYAVSPNAKVIMLNWRTFEQWRKSLVTFGPLLALQIQFLGVLNCAVVILPWGWLFHIVDPLFFDRWLEKVLKSGGPAFCQEYGGAYFGFWHGLVAIRRIATRWMSGLAYFPDAKELYDLEFQKVKDRVPKDRLMEVDPRKHTYEDICRFLEIKDCKRSGKFDKAVNLFNFEHDFPEAFFKKLPILLLLHYLNFKILFFLWRSFKRVCGCGKRAKSDAKSE